MSNCQPPSPCASLDRCQCIDSTSTLPDETTPLFPASLPVTTRDISSSPFGPKRPVLHFWSLLLFTALMLFVSSVVTYIQLKHHISLFALHPIFMAHGAALSVIAIALHQSRRHLLSVPLFHLGTSYSFTLPNYAHSLVAAFSIIFSVVGLCIIVFVKSANGQAHFVSPHGIVGLIAMLTTVAQGVVAVTGQYTPKLYGGVIRARKFLRKTHARTGYLVMFAFITALWFGIEYLGLPSQTYTNLLHAIMVTCTIGVTVRVIAI